MHDTFYRLYEFPDKYVFLSDNRPTLFIDRQLNEIFISDDPMSTPDLQPKIVYAIWGVIHLLAGPYLVVATKRELVGEIYGHSIWRILKTEIFPFKTSNIHLTDEQKNEENYYKKLLNHSLKMQSFYYSDTYDITHTMQRLHEVSPDDFGSMSLYERADERFVWNKNLLQTFVEQENLRQFCVPIMLGFISISAFFVKEQRFSYVLISRRSTLRAGVRLYMRGVDSIGNAANFVETEQIMSIAGNHFSFVQTRGSVPLAWSQYPNLRYKPKPQIIKDHDKQVEMMRRHFDEMSFIHKYGRVVVINLLDQKGIEKELAETFGQCSQRLYSGDLKYVPFDFHKECKKMQWNRLSILINNLMPDMDSMGYFHITSKSDNYPFQLVERARRQEGVFRTNCIDCLDRTNVVQSMIAYATIEFQLRQIGVLRSTESLIESLNSPPSPNYRLHTKDFYWAFKSIWTDNADYCSLQYTGSPALKTDFTRTGKRTILGALKDGYNSTVRYVYNNFYDGFHQDAIDLLLGHNVQEEKKFGNQKRKSTIYKYLLVLFVIMLLLFALFILLPADTCKRQRLYASACGTVCFVLLVSIFTNGQHFVSKPSLRPIDEN